MSKYGENAWGWVPKKVPWYRLSSLWAVIYSFEDESNVRGEVFVKGLGVTVGEGKGVPFWYNDWVGVGPLCFLFPIVFRVISKKKVHY